MQPTADPVDPFPLKSHTQFTITKKFNLTPLLAKMIHLIDTV